MEKAIFVVGLASAALAASSLMAAPQNAAEMPQVKTESPEEVNDSILGATYEDLEEVVVQGVRPVVTTDGATTTYNVEEDPTASGMTLLDMLRKVPMVSVDADDNIKLKGESNYKILINGQSDPTLSANASQIFKMMPADAVVKIEVITEPGAKYDAEGTGGIINLITIRSQKQAGYSGGVSAYINSTMSGLNLNARMKTGNFTVGADFGYGNGRYNPQSSTNDSEQIYLDEATGQPTSSLREKMDQKTPFDYLNGSLKLSWEPTEQDLISAGATINRMGAGLRDTKGFTTMRAMTADAAGNFVPGAELWSYDNLYDAHIGNLSTTADISYQHNFSPSRHFLALSYLFSYGTHDFDIRTENINAVGITPTPISDNRSSNINREHTVQLDYTNDFNSSKHLLEVGAKGIFRHNSAFGTFATGRDSQSLVVDDANRTNLSQIQDVAALYASYTGNFGNVGVKGGLRYEYTHMANTFHIGNQDNYSRNLNDLVPNAAITYSFGPVENLRLAYQMRISRPTIEQVNPYRMVISDFTAQQGNPDLNSEHSNNVSLTYSNFGGRVGGTIGAEYTQVDDMISPYHITDGVQYVSTYGNIGRKRAFALNGFMNWTIIPRMTLGFNGRLEYLTLRSDSPHYSNHGWGGNLTANWNYMTTSDWTFSAYGGWSARNIELQGTRSGWYYYGVGVNRKLLSDKSLTIGVNASNFLQGRMHYDSETITGSSIVRSHYTVRNWNVGVNISWTFGSLKQDVRSVDAKIVNDDQSQAKGSSVINN